MKPYSFFQKLTFKVVREMLKNTNVYSYESQIFIPYFRHFAAESMKNTQVQ